MFVEKESTCLLDSFLMTASEVTGTTDVIEAVTNQQVNKLTGSIFSDGFGSNRNNWWNRSRHKPTSQLINRLNF